MRMKSFPPSVSVKLLLNQMQKRGGNIGLNGVNDCFYVSSLVFKVF